MADVFISYARADRERVDQIADGLEADGFSVWWDSSAQGGGPPDRDAETHLAAAGCVVVAWSGASINRRWVRNHAREGVERDILVPVLLADVNPPMAFRDQPTEDLSRWDGDTDDPRWQNFVAAVHSKVQPEDTASPASSDQAPSPKTRKQKSSRDGFFGWSVGLSVIGLLVAAYVLVAG